MTLKTAELKKLNEEYQVKKNSLMVLYGREGCEKEQYLSQFLKDKQYVYYRAREVSAIKQRKMFLEEIRQKYQIQSGEDTYESCFREMQSCDGSKLVLVIDAFEYIVKKDKDFFESIVKLKENRLSGISIMILLCSSSTVWVEQKMKPVLENAAKKIDCIHKMKDLNFLDVVRFFPDNSVRECVEVYGILGGVPAYLKWWNPKADKKTNICDLILSQEGRLFGEVKRYLGGELRELSVYNTILTEIGAGNRKLNDLYQSTGYSRAKISVYLKNLMEMDVIEKVVSFETGGWENVQKGIYQIKNTFINFWFKFVFPYASDIYHHTPEEFYDLHIAGGIEEYLNRYFIQVCMEYMELLNQVRKLPIQISKIGTWVGKQGNIDIIAQNSIRENIVGICNWSEDKMTYERFLKLSELMKQARIQAKQYYLFSAKEFDETLLQKAKEDPRFLLIDMTEL